MTDSTVTETYLEKAQAFFTDYWWIILIVLAIIVIIVAIIGYLLWKKKKKSTKTEDEIPTVPTMTNDSLDGDLLISRS